MLVEALIPHAAVDALHERVLIRLAWLNVVQGHAVLRHPDRERPTDERGRVVTDDPTGSAARGDQPREHRRDRFRRRRFRTAKPALR